MTHMNQLTECTPWNIVSNSYQRTLELTGIVRHVDGCGASNGRNVLIEIPYAHAGNMKHCDRCERIVAA